MENVGRWIKHIEALLSDVEIQISEDFELFVEIEGENCAYYLVDHATCAQFWLESSDTDKLGLQQVCSASQLSKHPKLSACLDLNFSRDHNGRVVLGLHSASM